MQLQREKTSFEQQLAELNAKVEEERRKSALVAEQLKRNMGCNIDCLEFLNELNILLKSYVEEPSHRNRLMPFSAHGMKQAPLRSLKDLVTDLSALKKKSKGLFAGRNGQ